MPASAMRTGSNNRKRRLKKWKVLVVVAVILAAAISAAHQVEDSDLNTNLARTAADDAGVLHNKAFDLLQRSILNSIE